jgi:hypothetical protein
VLDTDDKEARMHTRHVTSSILLVAVSAVMAHGALAAGEPKNDRPFTRPVADRVSQSASRLAPQHVSLAAEPKNEAPFNRHVIVTYRQPSVRGESKNMLPFTASAPVGSAVVDSGSGFNWTDALLGVVLGISLSVAAAGATLFARRRVPRPA